MLLSVNDLQSVSDSAIWIIIGGDKVLIDMRSNQLPQVSWEQLTPLHAYSEDVYQLLDFQGQHSEFYVVDTGNESINFEHYEFVPLRHVLMYSVHEPFGIAGRAWQYTHFYRTHRYCGRCGAKTYKIDWEVAVQCPRCHHRCYPRVSPCVIVAVYKQDGILLAQSKRHLKSGFFSVIAGFVESGEGLEAAVHREVEEEVGVRIHNPEYFGSQPWPFPHALMVGYIAKWREGDIKIDEHEIAEANWYAFDALPKVPPKFSIASELIEHVINMQQK